MSNMVVALKELVNEFNELRHGNTGVWCEPLRYAIEGVLRELVMGRDLRLTWEDTVPFRTSMLVGPDESPETITLEVIHRLIDEAEAMEIHNVFDDYECEKKVQRVDKLWEVYSITHDVIPRDELDRMIYRKKEVWENFLQKRRNFCAPTK